MSGVLVVPGRRGLGYIRGLGADPESPELLGPSPQDLDHVLTGDEVIAFGKDFTNADEALAAWKFLARSVALREKAAYMSSLWLQVKSDPELADWIRSTTGGSAWYTSLQASAKAFQDMTQPNLHQSLKRLMDFVETSVLVGFGQGVRGRMPIYRNGVLDYADFNSGGNVRVKTIFDAGDLQASSIREDVDAIKDAKAELGKLDPKILGNPFPPAAIYLIIVIAGVLAAYWTVVATVKIFKSDVPEVPDIPPAPPAPSGVDQATWQREWIDKHIELRRKQLDIQAATIEANRRGFWDKAESLIWTLAIGTAIIGVTGGVLYYILKD